MIKRLIAAISVLLLTFTNSTFAAEPLGTPDMDDIEYPEDEAPSAEEVNLGKILFFDSRLSINQKQSCATCHNPDLGFSDGMAKGIGAFERTVNTMNSPFDRYIAGDKSAMDPAAIRGMELFKGKANCIECHDGTNFTDNSFHNIGVNDGDEGRRQRDTHTLWRVPPKYGRARLPLLHLLLRDKLIKL